MPYRKRQDLRVFPHGTVQGDSKQLPECVHLFALKGSLKVWGEEALIRKGIEKTTAIQFPKKKNML